VTSRSLLKFVMFQNFGVQHFSPSISSITGMSSNYSLRVGGEIYFHKTWRCSFRECLSEQFLKENSNHNNNGGLFLFKNSSYWLKMWYRHENTEFSHFRSTMIQVGALHCTDQKNLNKDYGNGTRLSSLSQI